MSHYKFTETDVELAALEWLSEIGYSYLGGSEIASGENTAERDSCREVIPVDSLLQDVGFVSG